MCTTSAPASRASRAVSSTLRSSITTSSSTSPPSPISDARIVVTSSPIVSASFWHGMQTETVSGAPVGPSAASLARVIASTDDARNV